MTIFNTQYGTGKLRGVGNDGTVHGDLCLGDAWSEGLIAWIDGKSNKRTLFGTVFIPFDDGTREEIGTIEYTKFSTIKKDVVAEGTLIFKGIRPEYDPRITKEPFKNIAVFYRYDSRKVKLEDGTEDFVPIKQIGFQLRTLADAKKYAAQIAEVDLDKGDWL